MIGKINHSLLDVSAGLAAAAIVGWKVDRERYRDVPFYSDGKPGPAIELRDFFAQFLNEIEGNK